MENLVEEFFKDNDKYLTDLHKSRAASDKYPQFETLVTSAFIATKIKAEFSAMKVYYRNVAIPNAIEMVDKLGKDFAASVANSEFPSLYSGEVFNDIFGGVLRESLMSGYISISHKSNT